MKVGSMWGHVTSRFPLVRWVTVHVIFPQCNNQDSYNLNIGGTHEHSRHEGLPNWESGSRDLLHCGYCRTSFSMSLEIPGHQSE